MTIVLVFCPQIIVVKILVNRLNELVAAATLMCVCVFAHSCEFKFFGGSNVWPHMFI